MKRTYLNSNGELVMLSHKELGASWDDINTAYVKDCTKQEHDFLEKYGLQPTIFNVANLRKYSHVHLTDHYVKVVLDHGAIDRRHDDEYVMDIVKSVKHGLRAIKELRKCNCPKCQRAIQILSEPADRNTFVITDATVSKIQDRHRSDY